jgi:hypothetical protein
MFVFSIWMLVVALTAVVIDAAVPVNDECDSALELVPSDTAEVTGSTIDATVDGLNICGENLMTSPGVWYSYQQSSDSVIHTSTCTN